MAFRPNKVLFGNESVFFLSYHVFIGGCMPKVGKKHFSYTAKGKAKAKSYAKKVGKKVTKRKPKAKKGY